MSPADRAEARPELPRDILENPQLSRWLTIRTDDVIELRVGKVELGQGILTALAQVAAQELDVAMAQVKVLPADTATGPDEGLTAGSMSVFDAAPAVRHATAHARELFRRAAASAWGVDAGEVRLASGAFSDPDGGRRATYGELVGLVETDLDLRSEVDMVTARGDSLVGVSAPRIDLPAKIAGRPSFIADLRLPGQLFGRVLRPPSPGARLVKLDDSVLTRPTLEARVVRDGSFVGVVADEDHLAEVALNRLRGCCTWEESDTLPDEERLDAFLRAGPHEHIEVLAETGADLGGAPDLRASYSKPFLAHGSIAPSCGIARWNEDGSLDVWSHSQGIYRLRDAIAGALGLDAALVRVTHVENAGCYGHNGADDAAFDAVLLAREATGHPVQVRWSRQDELSWAPLGSAMASDVAATVDDSGRITSWTYDVYSQGHTARPGYAAVPGLLAGLHLEQPLSYPAPADPPVRAGGGSVRNSVPLYDVGVRRVTGHRVLDTPIRSSAMRALGAFLNVFSIESFMDELALHVGQDPLEFRLRHLGDERGRQVLETAAGAAGWGDPLPESTGRGIGFARYKDRGAYCAVLAEVQAESDIAVRRLTVAVDVGRVINPDGVRNQIEGGAVQATSWATKERVGFDRRSIRSVDWESYPILRFSEVPLVEVHLVSRPDLPSVGAGEAAQGPTAAAIGNGLAAALGVRVRNLPLTPEAVVAAIENQT